MATRDCEKSINAHVGARLRLFRAEAGLSQEQLAAELGLSFQQIQRYESGMNRISAGALFRLAQIVGKPVADFFPESAAEIEPGVTSRGELATMRALSRVKDPDTRAAVRRLLKAIGDNEGSVAA